MIGPCRRLGKLISRLIERIGRRAFGGSTPTSAKFDLAFRIQIPPRTKFEFADDPDLHGKMVEAAGGQGTTKVA